MVKIAKPQIKNRLRIVGERGRRGTPMHSVILTDGGNHPSVVVMPFMVWNEMGKTR